uniref:Rab-GAP TBC domain-containing protein n=1 Tax=Lotharella globosa TaxID=91324 RepID=A0A7S4DUS9_9EUKA
MRSSRSATTSPSGRTTRSSSPLDRDEPQSLLNYVLSKLFPRKSISSPPNTPSIGNQSRPMHLSQRAPPPPTGRKHSRHRGRSTPAVTLGEGCTAAQSAVGRRRPHIQSMYQPSFIVNEEAADPFEGQDGLEEFNRIRAEGILDAVDAEHMGGGLSPGVPQRNRLRSESVDVLWLSQKRTVKLTSAWWNLKQRDVDSLRRGRAPVSPTGPRRQRKRSVVSPMLVQRQRVPGIPGVPSSSSYLGRPQATSNRAADTKESKAGGSGYRYHKHGKRHTSSIWGRIWRGDSEGTAIDTEKERKKWRDMKQVDRMYQNNLFRRYQARKLRSRAASQAQTPDTMSVASGTSEPTSLSSSAHLRHRTTPAAVPQRPRSNAQANGGEADRIRQERFWRETVIPSWSEIADAPMVRKLWDQYGVPPKLRRHVWPLALGCREDSENGAVSYEACLKREQDRCDKMDVKSPEGVNGSEALVSSNHEYNSFYSLSI